MFRAPGVQREVLRSSWKERCLYLTTPLGIAPVFSRRKLALDRIRKEDGFGEFSEFHLMIRD